MLGVVTADGALLPNLDMGEERVRQCYHWGLRQMAVPNRITYKGRAAAVAAQVMEDGKPMLTFLLCDHLLDALPLIFPVGDGL